MIEKIEPALSAETWGSGVYALGSRHIELDADGLSIIQDAADGYDDVISLPAGHLAPLIALANAALPVVWRRRRRSVVAKARRTKRHKRLL